MAADDFRRLGIKTKTGEEKKGGIRQDDLNPIINERILRLASNAELKSALSTKEGDKTALEKHLYKYARRVTSDFFVHKNLKGFLEGELDCFIKTEVIDLGNLEPRHITRAKVMEGIGRRIIEFLSQIEEFQKRLWEKKKFVIRTDYVITLDLIPEDFHKEILDSKDQLREWKELGFGQFKKENLKGKKLPVDTKHFPEDFKERLLEKLSEKRSLDDLIDGVLIKSDNFHALKLLLAKYAGKVKCTYIDPPYNTGSDEFLYKDKYRHSSWLSMMADRLMLARDLMEEDGVIFVSVDDNEQSNLKHIMDFVFGPENFITAIVWEGGLKNDSRFVSVSQDYIVTYVKNKGYLIQKDERWRTRKEGIDEIYGLVEKLKQKYKNDYEHISEELKQWYASLPKAHPAKAHSHYSIVDERGVFFPGDISWPGGGGPMYAMLHPVTGKPVAKPRGGWRFSTTEKMKEAIAEGRVLFGPDEKTIPNVKRYLHETEGQVLPAVFYRDRRAASKQLRDIMGADLYANPKDPSVLQKLLEAAGNTHCMVADFFAGSGPTAHAVVNLNREDSGRRKYVLVDMADYFDTVMLPRIKKIVYTDKWKDGKAILEGNNQALSHVIKYHYLEQYEDSLHNIEFPNRDKGRKLTEFLGGSKASSEYLMKYSLQYETDGSLSLLSLNRLENPFDYKLNVISNGNREEAVNLDPVETFNYLIGLSVNRYRFVNASGRKYVFALGQSGDRRVAVVWRPTKEIDLQKDREIINEVIRDYSPDETYINGDASVEGYKPIEPEFKVLLGA